jgi:hypothetical protein
MKLSHLVADGTITRIPLHLEDTALSTRCFGVCQVQFMARLAHASADRASRLLVNPRLAKLCSTFAKNCVVAWKSFPVSPLFFFCFFPIFPRFLIGHLLYLPSGILRLFHNFVVLETQWVRSCSPTSVTLAYIRSMWPITVSVFVAVALVVKTTSVSSLGHTVICFREDNSWELFNVRNES